MSVIALANNQLSGYGYDAAGNMTHNATTGNNYTYDAENRITGASGYGYTRANRSVSFPTAGQVSPPAECAER